MTSDGLNYRIAVYDNGDMYLRPKHKPNSLAQEAIRVLKKLVDIDKVVLTMGTKPANNLLAAALGYTSWEVVVIEPSDYTYDLGVQVKHLYNENSLHGALLSKTALRRIGTTVGALFSGETAIDTNKVDALIYIGTNRDNKNKFSEETAMPVPCLIAQQYNIPVLKTFLPADRQRMSTYLNGDITYGQLVRE